MSCKFYVSVKYTMMQLLHRISSGEREIDIDIERKRQVRDRGAEAVTLAF